MRSPPELPEPVLEAALSRLTGAEGAARDVVLAELEAAWPAHAEALRALSLALQGTDRLLARSFVRPAPDDPAQIGPYRVLRRLGEGAFGVVYLCAQDAPIRRQVAVKVLRPGAGDAGTLARFEAERQVLVGFDHPGIASLIDAGTLPDGRPYFTMEHVDGVPLTRYCDSHRLSVEARLRLCRTLCEGVAHAHACGVVHRDLKPANVLVVDRDGKPVPKIIDFGIAKALRPPADAAETDRTTTGRVIGTPGYMSPEQASGTPTEVDARADVFSIGVILYELLVGARPWNQTPSTDSEPPRPSTHVQSDAAGSPAIAGMRSTELRMLVSKLRGELDWVVLKALQYRREQRYQSARELAEDIERYLQGEPVKAGPPSAATRLRNVIRRHRTVFAVGSAVVLLGAAGAGVGWLLRRDAEAFHRDAVASTHARLADAEAAVKKLVVRAFDARLLDAPSGEEMRRDLLRDAMALHDRVLRERSEDPDHRWLRALILNHLADVHFRCSQFQQSIDISAEAEREAEALLVLHPARTTFRVARATALRNLGRCHILLGNREQARSCSDGALYLLDALHAEDGDSHANLLAGTLLEHASVLHLAGDREGERKAQARAIGLLENHLRSHPEHAVTWRDLVRSLCGLCGMLQRDGRTDEAEATVLRARSLLATSPGITDEERAIVSRRLGLLYVSTSRPREAVAELTSAIATTEQLARQRAGWKMLRAQLRELRTLLYEQQHRLGEYEAADRQAGPAIADAEALAPDHPRCRSLLADTLSRLAWAAVAARRDMVVGGWIERCLDLTEPLASTDDWARSARERALVARRIAAVREDVQAGRLAEARSALQSLTRRVEHAEYLLHAACSWAEVAGTGRRTGAADVETVTSDDLAALTALERAVDLGFCDRAWLLARPELQPLHDHPGFERLLSRLPD